MSRSRMGNNTGTGLGMAVAIATLTALLIAGQAGAERSQRGNLQVSLKGGISPTLLPRDRKAPVVVHLSGGIRTTDHSHLPRVNRLKLQLGWRGRLNVNGLPVCPAVRLR